MVLIIIVELLSWLKIAGAFYLCECLGVNFGHCQSSTLKDFHKLLCILPSSQVTPLLEEFSLTSFLQRNLNQDFNFGLKSELQQGPF